MKSALWMVLGVVALGSVGCGAVSGPPVGVLSASKMPQLDGCALLQKRMGLTPQRAAQLDIKGQPILARYHHGQGQSVASAIVSHTFEVNQELDATDVQPGQLITTYKHVGQHPDAKPPGLAAPLSAQRQPRTVHHTALPGLPCLLYISQTPDGPRVEHFVPVHDVREARTIHKAIASGQCGG